MKHIRLFLLASALLLILLPLRAPPAAAGGAVTTYNYTFAQQATFTFILPPGEAAREVQLYLRIDDRPIEMHNVPIEEGRAVYRRDLRTHPFPPFAPITFWWSYPLAGSPQQTEEHYFLYEDNRFNWHEIGKDGITVKWVEGDEALMLNALDIAIEARETIGVQLQYSAVEPMTLYIYPSQADLQLALLLSGESWVGGEARPEVGVILLAIPPTEEAALQMQRDIPHEMTHMLLYRRLGESGYHNLPAWLNEGLATRFEQRHDASYAVALEKALSGETIIPLKTLCRPFYDLPDERVLLAYAESYSVVTYIQQRYGWSAIRGLLSAYQDGLDCSSGVQQVLGKGLGEVEREWLTWLGNTQGEGENGGTAILLRLFAQQLAPWLLLLAALSTPLLLTLLVHPKGR